MFGYIAPAPPSSAHDQKVQVTSCPCTTSRTLWLTPMNTFGKGGNPSRFPNSRSNGWTRGVTIDSPPTNTDLHLHHLHVHRRHLHGQRHVHHVDNWCCLVPRNARMCGLRGKRNNPKNRKQGRSQNEGSEFVGKWLDSARKDTSGTTWCSGSSRASVVGL